MDNLGNVGDWDEQDDAEFEIRALEHHICLLENRIQQQEDEINRLKVREQELLCRGMKIELKR